MKTLYIVLNREIILIFLLKASSYKYERTIIIIKPELKHRSIFESIKSSVTHIHSKIAFQVKVQVKNAKN